VNNPPVQAFFIRGCNWRYREDPAFVSWA